VFVDHQSPFVCYVMVKRERRIRLVLVGGEGQQGPGWPYVREEVVGDVAVVAEVVGLVVVAVAVVLPILLVVEDGGRSSRLVVVRSGAVVFSFEVVDRLEGDIVVAEVVGNFDHRSLLLLLLLLRCRSHRKPVREGDILLVDLVDRVTDRMGRHFDSLDIVGKVVDVPSRSSLSVLTM